jgi:hypothetical protein
MDLYNIYVTQMRVLSAMPAASHDVCRMDEVYHLTTYTRNKIEQYDNTNELLPFFF